MKYRVLIRAHTLRRDVAPLVLFQKVLERMGCVVLIAGTRDFNWTLSLWKPHVTVLANLGIAKRVKDTHPAGRVMFLDAEGFHAPGKSNAEYWAQNPENYEVLDLAMVWGRRIIDEVREFAPNLDLSKLHVVGNPKFDLLRYLPDRLKSYNSKPSIGVVCRFHNLNDYEGRSTIRTLPNPGNLERVLVQVRSFGATIDVIRAILARTDYGVSLRPHPSEQVESYQMYKSSWFMKKDLTRISVDDTIDFSAWAVGQRALLSPSSTSFLEAYLLGVPVINLDKIADTIDQNRHYAPVVGEWQNGGVMPKDVDEVCRLLNEGLPKLPRIKAIETQLNEYCDWQSKMSSCFRAATLTTQLLKESKFRTMFHWPTKWVDLRDAISFKRAMLQNPLHHNFNYRRGHHEVPAHYDEMVDRILAESTMDHSI